MEGSSEGGHLPTIEGFVDLRVIGRGGSSTVYAAVQTDLHRNVALKVIESSDDSMNRLEREVRALGQLSDISHIVPVYGVVRASSGQAVLVMPLLRESLTQSVRRGGPRSVGEVSRWASDLSSSLDQIHLRGVVHRDIKPENVLLDTAGAAYLVDFGIASLDSLASRTATVMSISPPHSPPERLRGEHGSSVRGDVYSLASTLYYALAGYPPFGTTSDGGALGLIDRITTAPVPAAAQIPAPMLEALATAMAKDPADRYSSAGVFATQLAAAAASCRSQGADAVAASPVSSVPPVPPDAPVLTDPGTQPPLPPPHTPVGSDDRSARPVPVVPLGVPTIRPAAASLVGTDGVDGEEQSSDATMRRPSRITPPPSANRPPAKVLDAPEPRVGQVAASVVSDTSSSPDLIDSDLIEAAPLELSLGAGPSPSPSPQIEVPEPTQEPSESRADDEPPAPPGDRGEVYAEDPPGRKRPVVMWAALVLVVAALIGGGFVWLNQAPPDDVSTDGDESVDDGEDPDGEVTTDAEHAKVVAVIESVKPGVDGAGQRYFELWNGRDVVPYDEMKRVLQEVEPAYVNAIATLAEVEAPDAESQEALDATTNCVEKQLAARQRNSQLDGTISVEQNDAEKQAAWDAIEPACSDAREKLTALRG